MFRLILDPLTGFSTDSISGSDMDFDNSGRFYTFIYTCSGSLVLCVLIYHKLWKLSYSGSSCIAYYIITWNTLYLFVCSSENIFLITCYRTLNSHMIMHIIKFILQVSTIFLHDYGKFDIYVYHHFMSSILMFKF